MDLTAWAGATPVIQSHSCTGTHSHVPKPNSERWLNEKFNFLIESNFSYQSPHFM